MAQLDTPPGQLHDPLTALLHAYAYRSSKTGAMSSAHLTHIQTGGTLQWDLPSMSGNTTGGWKSKLPYSLQTRLFK